MRKQWLFVLALFSMAVLTLLSSTALADNNSKKTGNVKLYTNAVEVVDVQPSAEKCAKSKGTTVRLRVTSESPVDIKLYSPGVFGKNWIDKDFPNQKKGDEITDFMCGDANATYKVYARAAGSSEAWPRP